MLLSFSECNASNLDVVVVFDDVLFNRLVAVVGWLLNEVVIVSDVVAELVLEAFCAWNSPHRPLSMQKGA